MAWLFQAPLAVPLNEDHGFEGVIAWGMDGPHSYVCKEDMTLKMGFVIPRLRGKVPNPFNPTGCGRGVVWAWVLKAQVAHPWRSPSSHDEVGGLVGLLFLARQACPKELCMEGIRGVPGPWVY